MKEIFDNVSEACSKHTTKAYSTSFGIAIKFLDANIQQALYNIYGFVRLGDEIVDSFHDFPKAEMLESFKKETHWAVKNGISSNPILNSFQHTVRKYNIEAQLYDQFLSSMEMDLNPVNFDQNQINHYILGSAEVVGLMCLKVFVDGDLKLYNELKPYAMKLGSAFQKINFLRDLNEDYEKLGRTYFPGINMKLLSESDKQRILDEIGVEFEEAFQGIKRLPKKARFGVYIAYRYYYKLFRKIGKVPFTQIMQKRVRIPNQLKLTLLVKSYFRHSFNIL